MQRAVATIAVVAALAAVAISGVTAQSCNMSFTKPSSRYGATYDLSNLINRSQQPSPSGKCGTGAWFSEDDSDPQGEKVDFYYCYNFCANLATPPPTSPNRNLCAANSAQGVGNFWQVSNSTLTGFDTDCHVISQASNVSWAMLDPLNPAIGVVQIYGNGDMCGSQGPRQVTVQFRCARNGIEPVFSQVSEDNVCDYSLIVDTIAACPLECPAPNGNLCNAHGVCGGDDDLGVVRCFCNNGFSGTDCSTIVGPVTPVNNGGGGGGNATSVLIAFVIILTIALLAMAVVLWRKIKRLNADDSRYGQLTDDGAKDAPRRPPTAASMGATSATIGAGAVAAPASAADARDQGAAHQLAAAVSTNA